MQKLRAARRPRARLSAIVATVVVVSACGANDGESLADPSRDSTFEAPGSADPSEQRAALPEPVQEFEINATEYSFEISPDPSAGLKPGWTLLRFHNIGGEPHQVMFARIKDGVDMSELAAAGANDSSGAGAIEFVDMIGGVSYIDARQDTTAMVNLTEGIVMAMCYVPDSQGVAHALMGMTSALTVLAPSDEVAPSDPDPSGEEVIGTIEFTEDGYDLPDDFGVGWYHVQNSDSDLHELAMMRLDEPIDDAQAATMVKDLAANKTPEVAVEAVGGMGAISAGFDGYLYLDLAAGDYLAVDFMPDPGEPRPHMLDGYYATFRV